LKKVPPDYYLPLTMPVKGHSPCPLLAHATAKNTQEPPRVTRKTLWGYYSWAVLIAILVVSRSQTLYLTANAGRGSGNIQHCTMSLGNFKNALIDRSWS